MTYYECFPRQYPPCQYFGENYDTGEAGHSRNQNWPFYEFFQPIPPQIYNEYNAGPPTKFPIINRNESLDMVAKKSSSVSSWQQKPSEKRNLRGRKLGAPDVYPLIPRQNEEMLCHKRLTQGYMLSLTNYEHESLVYRSNSAKLSKLDDCLSKSAALLAYAQHRHREVANATYDRERKTNREKSNASVGTAITNVQSKLKERSQWFTQLAKGRPLNKLARRIPHFRKKEEYLDYCVSYKIRPTRVIWLFKVIANIANAAQTKPKRTGMDTQILAEYRSIFVNVVTDMIKEMSTEDELSRSIAYKEKWPYVMCLIKRAIEDGVIDKQEFVNDVCDPFTTFFLTRDNPAYNNAALLRMFLLLISNFMRYFTMNVIIARRCAYMLSMKLRLMKEEFDVRKSQVIEDSSPMDTTSASCAPDSEMKSEPDEERSDKKPDYMNSFHEMIHECKAQRSNIYLMTAFLHTLVTDAPAALVWNKYKVSSDRKPPIISQLCGSPLDLLPCPVYELPIPPDCTKFLAIVKARTQEIMRRSVAVEEHWSLRQKDAKMFSKRIDLCLDVIGLLDSLDFKEKGVFDVATVRLFDTKTKVPHSKKAIHIDKIKLMFHWAIISEREGSHRAIVVCKILKTYLNRKQRILSDDEVQSVIDLYLNIDAPKDESAKYAEEFGNLIALFNELIRQRIFNHDQFVKSMISENGAGVLKPLCNTFTGPVYKSSVDNGEMECFNSEDPAGLIPLIQQFPEVKDEHHMPTLWYKETVLVQVPLPQTEEYRSVANQRSMIVYGMGTNREHHSADLKKIAREICKIWQKKIYVDFLVDANTVFNPHRMAAQKIDELLSKFRAQTYYDQVVICGWCTENYADMIWDFINGYSTQLPSMEGLDILCSMFETAQYLYGIFELCNNVLPLLPQVEKVVHHLVSEIIPGSLSSQLAYVFVSYLSKHYIAYLHCGLAPTITNHLFNIVEKYLLCDEYPSTCWCRVVSAFVFHSKCQLKESGLATIKIRGKAHHFEKTFTFGGSDQPLQQRYRYNSRFFKDVLEEKMTRLNIYSYHDYKKRLPSFDVVHNRYSFVINSFIAAQKSGRDFDRLSQMSVLCGHLSAQIPQLADYWISAIRVLCCQGTPSTGSFSELLLEVNVKDCSNHYAIATFVMLLVSKYAFSASTLINEMLGVISNVQRYYSTNKELDEYEPGVCLALQILACISCATDEPYLVAKNYKGFQEKVKLIPQTADERILAMMHNCELENVTFPMLSNICILQDTLKNRFRDLDLLLDPFVDDTMYRREYLTIIVKTVLATISDQEWVTSIMEDIVKSKNMEAFNHDRLKQNCLGQQLLRMGLRRKSERNIITELTNCDSKKMLIDKLLSVMNIWNFRATLFDLKLMIKEISPDGVQKHMQQSAIAADALLNEIGRACRDLFTSAYKEGQQLSDAPDALDNRRLPLKEMTKYWLVAPLVRWCPELNVPTNYHQPMSVCGKVLKEAGNMLDATLSAIEGLNERHAQGSWLLTQQSFINLILSCTKVEQKNNGTSKELLIASLLKQIQDYVAKTKEDPTRLYMDKYLPEREGVLLRLSLVGGIFPLICSPGQSENWGLLLFQIMLYGIVTHEQERVMYDTIYDMLSTLMLWTLIDEKNQTTSCDGNEIRHRWPNYAIIIKKIRKELIECKIAGNIRHLHQFFPIPKRSKPVICCEPYGTPPAPATGVPNRPQRAPVNTSVGIRHGRLALQPTEKIRLFTFDIVSAYFPDPQKSGPIWRWGMYQPLRSHWFPSLPHRLIEKYIQHKHITEFTRPPAYIHSENMPPDPFLTAPIIDVTGEPVSTATTSSTTSTTTTATANTVSISPKKEVKDTEKPAVDSPGSTAASPKLRTPKKEVMEPMDSNSNDVGPEIIPVSTTPDIKPAPIVQKTPPNTVSPKAGRGGGTRKRNSGSTGGARGGGPQPKQKRSNSRTDQNATPTSFASWPSHPQPPHMSTAPGIGGYMGQTGHQMHPAAGMPQPPNPAMNMHPPGPSVVNAGSGVMGQPPPMQSQPNDTREQLHSLLLKRMEEKQEQAQTGQVTQGNQGPPQSQQSMQQDPMNQSQSGGFNGSTMPGQQMNRPKGQGVNQQGGNMLPGQYQNPQQMGQQQMHMQMQQQSKPMPPSQQQQTANVNPQSSQPQQPNQQGMQKTQQASMPGMAPSNMMDPTANTTMPNTYQNQQPGGNMPGMGYGNQQPHQGMQAAVKPCQPTSAQQQQQQRQMAPQQAGPTGTMGQNTTRPQPPPIPQQPSGQTSQNQNQPMAGFGGQMRPGQMPNQQQAGMNPGPAQMTQAQQQGYNSSGQQPSQPPPAYNHPSHSTGKPSHPGQAMNQANAPMSTMQQQQQPPYGSNYGQGGPQGNNNTGAPMGAGQMKSNPAQSTGSTSQPGPAIPGLATVKTEPSMGQMNPNQNPHAYTAAQQAYQQQQQQQQQQGQSASQQMQGALGHQARNTMGQFAKDDSRMNQMPQQRQQMAPHGMSGAAGGMVPNQTSTSASAMPTGPMGAQGMGQMGQTSAAGGLGISGQITAHGLGSGGQLHPTQGNNYMAGMQETKPISHMGQPGMAVGPAGQPKAMPNPQMYNPGYQHPQIGGPGYGGMGQHVGYSQGGHMPNMGAQGMNQYPQQYMMNDNRMMGGHNQYPPYNQGPPYNPQ